ncbi:MAG: hypothetical protein ACLPKT_11850 [Methylocella sp.]
MSRKTSDITRDFNDMQNDTVQKMALFAAPRDYALWAQAEQNTIGRSGGGPGGGKTVQDEYDRLMLAKLVPPKRSLWSRIVGK